MQIHFANEKKPKLSLFSEYSNAHLRTLMHLQRQGKWKLRVPVPKRLFFSTTAVLRSHGWSGGSGWGEQSICVEPWYLMESCVQHAQTTCPDSKDLLSLRGKNLCPQCGPFGLINWPIQTWLLRSWGGRTCSCVQLRFIKILPDTHQ